VKAFHRLLQSGKIHRAMNLLVVGISGPETTFVRRLIAELELTGRVQLLEGLSDPELHWCYTRCEAVIAPSITEGFGLPVVEALLAGCKVVCSDIDAFREVGGKHCHFVSLGPGEEQRLAEAICTAISQPSQAPIEFPHLSAPLLSEQYVSLYRRIMTPVSLTHAAAFAAPLHSTSESQTL
jgi:glycosyltransferase involved in cell wall biosynthesis